MADKRQSSQNRQSVRAADDEDSSSSSSSYSEGPSDSGSNSNSLNAFANDGGFLERFKQMQEACKQQAASQDAQFAVPQSNSADTTSVKIEKNEPSEQDAAAAAKKRTLPFVGKRRGGKVLKTGIVHKPKVEDEEELPKDAWSRYLAEVRKYRERSCDDEEKTRPLVK